jgi:hypothetical protein
VAAIGLITLDLGRFDDTIVIEERCCGQALFEAASADPPSAAGWCSSEGGRLPRGLMSYAEVGAIAPPLRGIIAPASAPSHRGDRPGPTSGPEHHGSR